MPDLWQRSQTAGVVRGFATILWCASSFLMILGLPPWQPTQSSVTTLWSGCQGVAFLSSFGAIARVPLWHLKHEEAPMPQALATGNGAHSNARSPAVRNASLPHAGAFATACGETPSRAGARCASAPSCGCGKIEIAARVSNQTPAAATAPTQSLRTTFRPLGPTPFVRSMCSSLGFLRFLIL